MFLPDKSLKGIIMQELDKDDKSISSLYRILKDEDHKLHRLVLTGYLKAMEDMGVLRSKEIPPSKVYSISITAEKDIYESIGEQCRNLEVPDVKRPAIAMYVLQKLLKRPVFLGEIRRMGYDSDVDEIATNVSGDERQEVRKMLAKRGHMVPKRDPAYRIEKKYDREYDEILPHLLLQRFKVTGLAVDTKQTKLGL